MYGPNPMVNTKRVVKAVISNQLARHAPGLYVRLTGQTGRGSGPESGEEVAEYFETCFKDYCFQWGIDSTQSVNWLRGKSLLEYGPGDVPGVALFMLAHGAERVTCVDRFPLVQNSPTHLRIIECILQRLDPDARSRAEACFNSPGEPASGLRRDRLEYLVRPKGESGLQDCVDFAYSRAVLEHVNDLASTFQDIYRALKPGAMTVHQVDLKSHGLHRENPLDFLTWPVWLWHLMYSGKGVPNRWRIDRYREVIEQAGLEVIHLESTLLAEPADIDEIRPYLARPFKALSDEELSWLGFWLVARKPV